MSDMSVGQPRLPKTSTREEQQNVATNPGWAKRMVFRFLDGLPEGRLTIEDAQGVYHFGTADDHSKLSARIQVRHPRAYRQLLLGGSVGAGEAYMEQDWSTPCLVSVVRLMARNIDWLNRMETRWPWLQRWLNRVLHKFNANSLSGSRRNIAAHYDLGNDFFELFLDPQLMYSSAVFSQPQPSENVAGELEQASIYKLDLICRKLQLSPSDHLLEIGTGWGGMAIHAAKHYGCQVTTTTISRQQYDYARAAVEREGLQDKVTLLFEDYRNLQGQFDKLVSIEMIEAVGHEYYDTYFKRCSSLLKEDGLMLIQAITIPDQRYDFARDSVDFIQKYIFPGGGLPSVNVIASGIRRCTNMMMVDLQDIGLDYAETLKQWRTRFHQRLEEVKGQGFDEVFCRMWDYYLAYCEGGFRERAISTVQVVFAKPACRQIPSGVR